MCGVLLECMMMLDDNCMHAGIGTFVKLGAITSVVLDRITSVRLGAIYTCNTSVDGWERYIYMLVAIHWCLSIILFE